MRVSINEYLTRRRDCLEQLEDVEVRLVCSLPQVLALAAAK